MVQNGTLENFNIDEHDCMRFRNRICVPNVSELKEFILRKAHDSPFAMHLGGKKCTVIYGNHIGGQGW
ncbi:zinc finger and BTB domain-containing protein 11-like [Gossypium australe]|uniref:Zinc finger and BTB domain-containing protein 11-like n=1 Tax=Gossypium australe TaxID=47621 RepID=A0A5B6VBZ0_9ROSI|nr:zinc finger and BTB domain-containing protein 11-like [Gossypium australe]